MIEKTEEIILASQEAEDSIIAILLTDKDSQKYIEDIETEDFYFKKNRILFEIIKELYISEKDIDILTVKETGVTKKYDGVKLMETISSMVDSLGFSTNAEKTINILKNLSMKRKIQKMAKEVYKEVAEIDVHTEETEIKNDVIQKFKTIKTVDKKTQSELSDVICESMKEIEKAYNKRNDLSYKTGYLNLDKIIEGLHEQELTIVAARPGVGKTAFALQMAEHIAKKGVYTYFVSLEMSETQLGSRIIAREAEIDSHILRMGWLQEQDFADIVRVGGELSGVKMCIDSKSSTVQDIENKANELKNEKNLGLIVIDYLQLLKSKTKFNNREQEVADISRRLKILTKKLDIPIVALCQLNRETEKRKTPILADLRESGSLEQDADNVIFLYVEDEEKKKKLAINVSVIVSKQRNGPTGTIKMRFDRKQMKFEDLI